MNPARCLKAPRLAGLGLVSLVTPLFAQNALYVEHRQALHHVRDYIRHYAYVAENEKLVPAEGRRYTLQKVNEYLPAFVSVREMRARYRSADDMDGHTINKGFSFEAEFESPYLLERAFIVLELTSETGKFVFPHELGTLQPRNPKIVSVTVPVSEELGSGKFLLHVFADGREVFHSKIPVATVETALDRMVAKRIANVLDAAPRPLIGPAPEYPAKLRKAGVKGDAKVSFVISPHGRVLKPVIESASDPAFGEAALAAIRQWRFLPKVKAGHALETPATLPFVFTPPAAKS